MSSTSGRRNGDRVLPVRGERVALERTVRELTQAELGKLAAERLGRGVSRDTIARVEAGSSHVPDDLRVALADVFGIAPESLWPYPRLVPPAQRARTPKRRPGAGRRKPDDSDLERVAVA